MQSNAMHHARRLQWDSFPESVEPNSSSLRDHYRALGLTSAFSAGSVANAQKASPSICKARPDGASTRSTQGPELPLNGVALSSENDDAARSFAESRPNLERQGFAAHLHSREFSVHDDEPDTLAEGRFLPLRRCGYPAADGQTDNMALVHATTFIRDLDEFVPETQHTAFIRDMDEFMPETDDEFEPPLNYNDTHCQFDQPSSSAIRLSQHNFSPPHLQTQCQTSSNLQNTRSQLDADARFSPAANPFPSVGSVGHPHYCGMPCKYVWKRKGCKDDANCNHCHLCQWCPFMARVDPSSYNKEIARKVIQRSRRWNNGWGAARTKADSLAK